MSVFSFIFSAFAVGYAGGVLLALLVGIMLGTSRTISEISNV